MARLNDIKKYIHSMNEKYYPVEGSSALAVEANETEKVEPPPKPTMVEANNGNNGDKRSIIDSLEYGVDYGAIPKVKGNVLFKKGALKVIKLMGCKHTMTLVDKSVDVANGFIGYTVKVSVVDADGSVVTEAFGSANTLEKKFADKGFAADSMLIGMASKRALVECAKELLI